MDLLFYHFSSLPIVVFVISTLGVFKISMHFFSHCVQLHRPHARWRFPGHMFSFAVAHFFLSSTQNVNIHCCTVLLTAKPRHSAMFHFECVQPTNRSHLTSERPSCRIWKRVENFSECIIWWADDGDIDVHRESLRQKHLMSADLKHHTCTQSCYILFISFLCTLNNILSWTMIHITKSECDI